MTDYKSIALGIAVAGILGGAGTASAFIPGGTLDPTTVPKYVQGLVIPPVINDNGTAHSYTIALRQFKQQILPGGIWNTVSGRADAFPPTTVWSYGPSTDPAPDSSALGGGVGVAPAPNSQFNFPAYTMEAVRNVTDNVRWINDLKDPTTGNFLPHLLPIDQTVHWANPGGQCANGAPLGTMSDCVGGDPTPYTGPVPFVIHVHGSHVGPESDGYAEAWTLPSPTGSNFTCVDRTNPTDVADPATNHYFCEGSLANKIPIGDGSGTIATTTVDGHLDFNYPNDQASATIWYHDHGLGITRLNVYAGPAGFWLIRDPTAVAGQENGLAASNVLPGPAPVRGDTVLELNLPTDVATALGVTPKRRAIREIPVAIQDRSFNSDGSLFYPATRAFFDGYTGPYIGDPLVTTSDISPIWNPEFFGNLIVVNGTTWPRLTVAPSLYRFRLLNGHTSRSLNLRLLVWAPAPADPLNPTVDPLGGGAPTQATRIVYKRSTSTIPTYWRRGIVTKELDFYQIGTEQGLLPQVVRVSTGRATRLPGNGTLPGWYAPAPNAQQALLMGNAERADVLVDFRGLPNGTVVRMFNTAPDAPFGGFPDAPADPQTTGQILDFVVDARTVAQGGPMGASPTDENWARLGTSVPAEFMLVNPDTRATPPESLVIDPGHPAMGPALPGPRKLALMEEESTTVCVTLSGPNGEPVYDPTQTPPCAWPAMPMAPKVTVLGKVDKVGPFLIPTVTLWSDPIVTNPAFNTVEQWDIYNYTVDSHPMHPHMVEHNVVARRGMNGLPSLIAHLVPKSVGGVIQLVPDNSGLQEWEKGAWKDSFMAYPGEITSIKSKFDLHGLYVWHCHIVEHEDNEMMVPFCVGTPGVDCPPGL